MTACGKFIIFSKTSVSALPFAQNAVFQLKRVVELRNLSLATSPILGVRRRKSALDTIFIARKKFFVVSSPLSSLPSLSGLKRGGGIRLPLSLSSFCATVARRLANWRGAQRKDRKDAFFSGADVSFLGGEGAGMAQE